MKTLILFTCILINSSAAHAWGAFEQGLLTGAAGVWIFQRLENAQAQTPPQPTVPAVVQQRTQVPQQVIIQESPQVMCPPGLAAFYIQRYDRYGRPFYLFDGCR